AHFEARRGYANYFPNRLRQQVLLASLREQFPQPNSPQPDTAEDTASTANAHSHWQITAVTDDEAALPVSLSLSDGAFSLTLGERTIQAANRGQLYAGIEAANPLGILACLDAWRELLGKGTQGLGDCYYRGQIPLLGERPLR